MKYVWNLKNKLLVVAMGILKIRCSFKYTIYRPLLYFFLLLGILKVSYQYLYYMENIFIVIMLYILHMIG